MKHVSQGSAPTPPEGDRPVHAQPETTADDMSVLALIQTLHTQSALEDIGRELRSIREEWLRVEDSSSIDVFRSAQVLSERLRKLDIELDVTKPSQLVHRVPSPPLHQLATASSAVSLSEAHDAHGIPPPALGPPPGTPRPYPWTNRPDLPGCILSQVEAQANWLRQGGPSDHLAKGSGLLMAAILDVAAAWSMPEASVRAKCKLGRQRRRRVA